MTIEIAHAESLLSIGEASEWATRFLRKDITESNISYLVQYGKIRKYNGSGTTKIKLNELRGYYESFHGKREIDWKKRLGDDLNWALSFEHLREKDTTKHVHRLHPYKGKFIPQLVKYFIDAHIDNFKNEVYFKKNDIILDPFCGSGTTLVQANELGLHAIGIDVSHFNCTISEVKLLDYDAKSLIDDINFIKKALADLEIDHQINKFEDELNDIMTDFNNKYFPSPEYKYRIYQEDMNEENYSRQYEEKFLEIYEQLARRYQIKLKQSVDKTFLDKWYTKNIRNELEFVFNLIKNIKDVRNKKILAIILSRTARSCRATTHSDLATLKEPQLSTYYCYKHKKICKPLFSIKYWFARYANDTILRLKNFSTLKTEAKHAIIPADARVTDILQETEKRDKSLYEILQQKKIKGIFTSPPYVGQIDYHEQHAYAYDLFGFKRKDELEIGPLYRGQGIEARESYIKEVSQVLLNSKNFLASNFDIFLVANDKYNLYPRIAEKSGLKIVNQFKRPVLNRTERDKSPYAEIIFHLKQGS